MNGHVVVRTARAGDAAALREIERRAGERFRDVGMPEIADDEPPRAEVLAGYADAGRSWVAVDDHDTPVGYVIVDMVDGCAHVEQLSVDPAHQGRGIGRALIDRVRRWAQEQGAAALTLTTFADVPWNAPLYEHLGFRRLNEAEIGPGLRTVRDEETAHGLDPDQRVCMRAELSDGPAQDADRID